MSKENSICSVYTENNIVILKFNNFVILKYPDLVELFEYIDNVYGKERYLKLIDIRSQNVIDQKAKRFLENQKTKYRNAAIAILVGNNTNQEILDAFISLNSRKTPAKIFVERERAVYWLNSFAAKQMQKNP